MSEVVPPHGGIEDLALGSRRDVRGMAALLGELAPGTHITAVFRADLYGHYRVAGTITRSDALDTLVLAGRPLTTGATGVKPADTLVMLERLASPPQADPPMHVQDTVAAVGHGDLIAAHFDRRPYGCFTVTGFAVAAPPPARFALGGWLLTRGDGSVTAGIRAVTLLSPAAEHGAPVPAPIHRWPESGTV
ncbi:hypothetical protein [Nocardia sp. alder85J]|uniref:hypothetical protein n=1 Tax=Nocardia sp. alder85J TaxID=2862949 RepID=UPI001CD37CAE|nr:hypothetical protein [Nocardia sp. alder85J]MCX4095310.1 hypothetical protein [Nocardia sp. alder85J]